MNTQAVELPMSGHRFYTQMLTWLDQGRYSDEELLAKTLSFVESNCVPENSASMNAAGATFSDWDWLGLLFDRLPEQALWALLKGAVATRARLRDDAVRKLDDRMQGFLFFEPYVENRRVRIEFVRSRHHMIYLREAAGSRNVWLDDDEFSELVALDDSTTFACFARCAEMKPHHLLYIERKLAADPHRSEYLADSDEARITLKKAIEKQGQTPELVNLRAALQIQQSVGSGLSDAISLWQVYREIERIGGASVAAGAKPGHQGHVPVRNGQALSGLNSYTGHPG
jgi:hypothetical protein